MKSAHLLEQIAQLEGQKQNLSNEAAFKVGQALYPIDAKIAELRAQVIRDNTESAKAAPVEAPPEPAKRKGRPKGSKNAPKPSPVEEAQAS